MPAGLVRVIAVATWLPLLCAQGAHGQTLAPPVQSVEVPAAAPPDDSLDAAKSQCIRLPPIAAEQVAIESDQFALGGSMLGSTTPPPDQPTLEIRGPSADDSEATARLSNSGPVILPERSALARWFCDGEWYFQWGYNKDYWSPADIHVSQPALGNHFTIHNVQGHDEPGWTSGVFNKTLFGPQNNIRVGRFIDEGRTWALEFSVDHTKFTSTLDQAARVTGTIGGASADTIAVLDQNYFNYKLHNGANHVMMNIVKRLPLIRQANEPLSVALIAKAGVGLMVPHSENTVLGQQNNVGPKSLGNALGFGSGWWQIDGLTAGLEAGFRVVLARPIFLEVTDKVAYAQLGDIPVYQGTASHSLLMNEIIFSIGLTYDGASRAGP